VDKEIAKFPEEFPAICTQEGTTSSDFNVRLVASQIWNMKVAAVTTIIVISWVVFQSLKNKKKQFTMSV